MVREEIASMFTGTRYGVPFETKTVVALRGGRIVGSLSMHKGDAEWQMAYILHEEGDGAERINEELRAELLKACQGWGGAADGIILRHSPPWFYA